MQRNGPKEAKKIVVLYVSLVVLSVVAVALVGYYDAIHYTSTYRLDRQYIGSVQSGPAGGYDCVNGLVLDVHTEWYNLEGLQRTNHTFCARESELRDDLQPGDWVEIRWKRVNGERFAQGVARVDSK